MGRGAGKAKGNQFPPKLVRKNKKGKGDALELKINTKSASQEKLYIGQP